ncbi:hypothetical protein SLE2022_338850 [Rubroshorea leprosula]
MKKRTVQTWGLAVLSFIVLMTVTPQPQHDHDFADKREFLCIPNTMDVMSNFPVPCYWPHRSCTLPSWNYMEIRLRGERLCWTCFFISVVAVGLGSSYYHLKPNDAWLLWDWLPRVDVLKGTVSLMPLLLSGVTSNLYWRLFSDLRPYVLVQ